MGTTRLTRSRTALPPPTAANSILVPAANPRAMREDRQRRIPIQPVDEKDLPQDPSAATPSAPNSSRIASRAKPPVCAKQSRPLVVCENHRACKKRIDLSIGCFDVDSDTRLARNRHRSPTLGVRKVEIDPASREVWPTILIGRISISRGPSSTYAASKSRSIACESAYICRSTSKMNRSR